MQIKNTRAPFKIIMPTLAVLCLSLSLNACQKQKKQVTEAPKSDQNIELIQQDIIQVKQGEAVSRAAFSGTIRAVNQSTIQAQVTATASAVNVQVGQNVSQGQILVQLNNQDNASRLAQARANLASAQAQAQQANNMVQRKKRLYNQGFISKVEYEQSQVDYTGQLETVKAQQANVDIAVKADRDGLIRSPLSGVITKRQVEPGQTVAAGQTLFDIVDPSRLEIQASLPAEQQSALKLGNKVEYTIQGNPAKLSASLTRVSPIADPTSRQIEFFARPNETINSLSIGAFVEGFILGSNTVQGQQIPLDTIQDSQNKAYVWVVREKKIQQVFIRVLDQQMNSNIAIVSGLNPTDWVSRIQFVPEDINKTVVISAE
ncbi:efflux transporter periplasmic adaptor subunit [Acinetobacter sp. TGL-Y2]|uniref:efflux RND transporter periplasmic adaptor subunit n=1 Tax=Acinetobacter sp. TGL-Y2 TaxID=1407071 RepID=UPI0007A67928|nr:efflux RND transporter periplasmic adaptor subunit [Acinetobacter sp. TGL-Y2]AMW79560.1 efflux transporter periplasmic adaptor subunit [Acinetobacter sp. TGL-Y2]